MGFRAALLAVALLAGPVRATPDGDVAPAWRWSDPRGTVSGSRRSDAIPITRGVEEAWSVKFEAGPVLAPPVTWDGRLYAIAGTDTRVLYAVDLQDGAVLADRTLRGAPETAPTVWDGVVYVRSSPDRIEGHRLGGGRLKSTWSHRDPDGVGEPLVFEGEVYFGTGEFGESLRKIRAGSLIPVWEAAANGVVVGRPALRGGCVYAQVELPEGIGCQVFRKGDGVSLDVSGVVPFAPDAVRGSEAQASLLVTHDQVVLGSRWPLSSSAGPRSHAMIPYRSFGDAQRFDTQLCGLLDLRAMPAVHAKGLLALAAAERMWWGILQGPKAAVLASLEESPDLFESYVPATVLGDVGYFGTWAADVETLEVLWRLPIPAVCFGAVPGDGLVIVVDGEGVLRAYRERRHP